MLKQLPIHEGDFHGYCNFVLNSFVVIIIIVIICFCYLFVFLCEDCGNTKEQITIIHSPYK